MHKEGCWFHIALDINRWFLSFDPPREYELVRTVTRHSKDSFVNETSTQATKIGIFLLRASFYFLMPNVNQTPIH